MSTKTFDEFDDFDPYESQSCISHQDDEDDEDDEDPISRGMRYTNFINAGAYAQFEYMGFDCAINVINYNLLYDSEELAGYYAAAAAADDDAHDDEHLSYHLAYIAENGAKFEMDKALEIARSYARARLVEMAEFRGTTDGEEVVERDGSGRRFSAIVAANGGID